MTDTKRVQFPVYLFNTLTKQKEKFEPQTPNRVGLYVCGPTVYGEPHLGHARSALTFDVVARYFRHLGYKLRYVRNITDVGHMENEVAETGEDKIAKKARLEQLEPMEIVQTYTISYHKAMDSLNALRPSIEPTATGHILDQIKIIAQILENGYAYEVNDSIYFDLQKYAKDYPYGQLSGKVLEDLIVDTRQTEGMDEKRHPHDFALWKKANPSHIMQWDSPWGSGFPGWHIECTAMSTKYLGIPFDIHGGGMDLQFPHHEAEIAQCVAATGKNPIRYWMHNNMLTINGAKMSKSADNFITLAEMFSGNHKLLEQAYSPMIVRFFTLQAHYSSPVDFSNSALKAAEKGHQRLMTALQSLENLEYKEAKNLNEKLDTEIQNLINSCYQNMSDDFNTAKTLASLFEIGSKINAFKHQQLQVESIAKSTFEALKFTYRAFVQDVLGLKSEQGSEESNSKKSEVQDALIKLFIEQRKEARANKDFATSDAIRDNLAKIGVKLKDEKSGETSYSLD